MAKEVTNKGGKYVDRTQTLEKLYAMKLNGIVDAFKEQMMWPDMNELSVEVGAPGVIRTRDLRIRSPALYPG